MVEVDLKEATSKYKDIISKGKITAEKIKAGFLTDLISSLVKKYGKDAKKELETSKSDTD